jgi:hypothetical protein
MLNSTTFNHKVVSLKRRVVSLEFRFRVASVKSSKRDMWAIMKSKRETFDHLSKTIRVVILGLAHNTQKVSCKASARVVVFAFTNGVSGGW